MRAQQMLHQSGGSLLSDYASRMSDALLRRRAEIEVRAARVEAELAIKARSEFLANMNHELRTPLNAIIGFATMLREGDQYNLSAEQRETYCDYVLQSADLLLGHINTILEVAALESGGVELNDDIINLGDVLDEAAERARIRAEAAGVLIKRRDRGENVLGWGDQQRTGQAVDHLLQTAIKACGKKGKIYTRVSTDARGWAEIAVRDEGEGMTEAEVAHALDAFSELHRGLDRAFSGPGVGYAVAKTFIEMQGGAFFIKSKKKTGTLVRLSLPPPAEQSQTAPVAEQHDTRIDSATPEKLRAGRELKHDAA